MLRNLDVEFRGNGLTAEPYSRLARNGAVPLMKNACGPASEDVKTRPALPSAAAPPQTAAESS